ncbi:MAG: hypothetical protein U5N58_02550 [Actinomycetota bacterium]|nr:hypothetical protein [Actinomycetota bacterium]
MQESLKMLKYQKIYFLRRKLTISPKTVILKSVLIVLCAVTLLLSSSCQAIQNPVVKASEAVKVQNYDKAASYARLALHHF